MRRARPLPASVPAAQQSAVRRRDIRRGDRTRAPAVCCCYFVATIWLASPASRDRDRMRLGYLAFRADCVSDVGILYDFRT
jgi:hypothetical protein